MRFARGLPWHAAPTDSAHNVPTPGFGSRASFNLEASFKVAKELALPDAIKQNHVSLRNGSGPSPPHQMSNFGGFGFGQQKPAAASAEQTQGIPTERIKQELATFYQTQVFDDLCVQRQQALYNYAQAKELNEKLKGQLRSVEEADVSQIRIVDAQKQIELALRAINARLDLLEEHYRPLDILGELKRRIDAVLTVQ